MNKPKDATKIGVKPVLLGIIANIFLAVTKGVTGILGNSYALVADAIESSFDIFTSIIVYIGLKIAAKPKDHDHPYGHGKAEPLAAIVVALPLFIAAIIIAVQSIREIVTPHHVPAAFTLIVLVLVVIVKELLFRFSFAKGTQIRSTAVKNDAWHHRSDAITSAAAFIGISIALIGGQGYEMADDYAALLASFIIAFNAYRLLKPAMMEVTDATVALDVEEQVRSVAEGVKGVVALEKCFVRKMGFEYYVDLHVVVKHDLTVREGHKISHRVKNAITKSNPSIANVLIHIEPADRRKLKSKLINKK